MNAAAAAVALMTIMRLMVLLQQATVPEKYNNG
jgi:hypothetical protein